MSPLVMTNEPDENVIMTASINGDGTLVCSCCLTMASPTTDYVEQSLVNAVAAGGRGLHGVATPPGADGLFSQVRGEPYDEG